jgi:hypothetical protein
MKKERGMLLFVWVYGVYLRYVNISILLPENNSLV